MIHRIRVRRGAGVWVVEIDGDLFAFASASEAEQWARALADRGRDVELAVYDLKHEWVGTVTFHAGFALASGC